MRVLHWVRSSASSFKLKDLLVSLKSSSSFLRLFPQPPVPSIFSSVTCLRCDPSRYIFYVLWYVGCSFWLCNTSSFFTWSVQLNFPVLLHHQISELSRLFSEVSKFLNHTKVFSKCSALLASFINLSPVCSKKSLLIVECRVARGNPGFNFACTFCIIC
jgi:hypothetical protein